MVLKEEILTAEEMEETAEVGLAALTKEVSAPQCPATEVKNPETDDHIMIYSGTNRHMTPFGKK